MLSVTGAATFRSSPRLDRARRRSSSQRVADLLADGLPAESIVAFTFTERAAEELKNRIAHRVEDRLGRGGAGPARRAVRRHDPRATASGFCSSGCPDTRPTTCWTTTS